jgi:eukaryotic translation initiation factor 2C
MTAKRFPSDSGSWQIALSEEGGKRTTNVTVNLQYIRPINLADLSVFVKRGVDAATRPVIKDAIQALNVLVQHFPMTNFANRGPSFFPPPVDPQQCAISRGLSLWRGYYTSICPGVGTVYLNIDLASCPMVSSGNLADIMIAFAKERFNDPPANLASVQPRTKIAVSRFASCLRLGIEILT